MTATLSASITQRWSLRVTATPDSARVAKLVSALAENDRGVCDVRLFARAIRQVGPATIKRLDERSNSGSVCPSMKRELKPEEHEEIVSAIAAGDRVKATSIYLSATEGNLTEAQNYVKALSVEAESAESQRSSKKSR